MKPFSSNLCKYMNIINLQWFYQPFLSIISLTMVLPTVFVNYIKKAQRFALSFKLFAEREGFEPPEPFSSTVFKTAVIDHSTTSPSAENLQNPVWDCKDIHILCICKNKFVFSHQIDLCRKRAGRRADCWRHSCRGWECH